MMSLAATAFGRTAVCTAFSLAAAVPLGALASHLSGRSVSRALMLGGCGAGGFAVGIAAPTASLAAGLALALVLTLLAAVDMAALRLPDVLTLPLAVTGLAWAAVSGQAVTPRIIGAVLGFGSLAALAWGFRGAAGRPGLGLGDAKLFAAAGAWLGWDDLPQVVLIACGLGFAWVGVGFIATGPGALRRPIPFGAPLCVAFLAEWLLEGGGL